MKTVRELGERVIEAGKRSDDGGAYFPGFEGGVYALMEAIGEDAIVIEPSGVVLAVDREKLRDALVRAWIVAAHTKTTIEEYEREGLTPEGVAAVDAGVDAILTSMAEQGFREVDDGITYRVTEVDTVPVLLLPDGEQYGELAIGPGTEFAILKPLPPAKED